MAYQVYVSTTFHKVGQTKIEEVLALLKQTSQYGIELGSTHVYDPEFTQKVKNSGHQNYIVHNYCPPAPKDLILNIASPDEGIRNGSIQHIEKCLGFAADVGATLYTFHPGFLSDALSTGNNGKNYDFEFSDERTQYKQAIDLMKGSMEKIIKLSEKYEIPLAIETEGSVRRPDILLMQTPDEYMKFFETFGDAIGINLNLAHTSLAGKVHNFEFSDLYDVIKGHLKAVEISHCDLEDDEHKPLEAGSYVFDLVKYLPEDIPLILEFRSSSIEQIQESIDLLENGLGR